MHAFLSHLSKVRLGHCVALVAVFVSACFLAKLAVPSQLCKTLGLDPVDAIVNVLVLNSVLVHKGSTMPKRYSIVIPFQIDKL